MNISSYENTNSNATISMSFSDITFHKETQEQSNTPIMCPVIHLSLWLTVSSGPGDVLSGGVISAAVGGVLPDVTVRFWAGPSE